MTTPLFSTYSQQENLVTATFLAVLQRLSLTNMDRILQELLEDDEFSLVTFRNQPKLKHSTPDAKIGTSPGILIETKIVRGVVGHKQVKMHLKSLGHDEKLLLLTPDDNPPTATELDHNRVVWSNFRTLTDVVGKILNDESEPPSDREVFLLRELTSMLNRLGLTTSPADRVIVVPAAEAWPMYKQLSGYRRNRDIAYRPSDHIAFYTNGKIKPIVPKIKSMVESINITKQEEIESLCSAQKEHAKELWEKIESEGQRDKFNEDFMVMFLTECGDAKTLKLKNPIINDKKTRAGKSWAFVLGKARYVTLESLKKATKTSELKLC